ncbi:DUF4906 domain-containing protein [Bacteroides togonis]|uniref:DUF4906 domain-containing protein n=1 Tax=Bacteroides togonis TaxID=1917883 RepID=UPI00094AE31E|nr:DUF4906 domain-containing protein [Bacteroides togonis]
MNRYGLKIMTALLLVGGMLASCIRDEAVMPGNDKEGVNLIISVAGMGNQQLTRATSDRTDRSRIEDMNIVLADASGVIQEIIYLKNPTETSQDVDMEDNGLIEGNLPIDNGTLVYHVGSTSWAGKSKIFVVCNYWQIDRNTGEILPDKNDLNNCLTVGKSTIDDLKALQQGTPFKPGIMTSTLFGEAVQATGTDTHGGQNYTCELKRTTAMITVAITSGSNGEKLKDGVKITPRSICLHNVPVNCNIGIDNSVNTDDRIWEEGLVQQVGWEPLTSANDGMTVGGHGTDANIVPLFMFENLQGKMNTSNENEIDKAPDADKAKYCSYIEVIADYLYTPQATGENQKYISGPIKYRLYLGEDILNDFNVYRNKHYQVTLSLKGMGGLVEDGRTNPDGSYIGDGDGASWRVESIGISGGGSFLSDGLNMSSNGFLSYVGFVKEEGHEYGLYATNNKNWLWAGNTNGTDLSSIPTRPDRNNKVTEFPGEECGGEPGAFYFKLYAQAWIDEYDGWKNDAIGDISTITNWINNGYRQLELHLYDFTISEDVSVITVRQWLPMPVMVDDNGTPISSNNLNDASFYYSRIDVYEGREIPWGPDYFNNNWNASQLVTNKWQYYKGYWGSTRNYNPDYGFDVMVALYGTNPNAFTFQKDYGRPSNAVGTAIFRAGNAVTSSGGSISYEFSNMSRIGLPTVNEWEKIMQYGVVDVRFGISNVPYWTSTMEGTKSYSYNPITGEKTLDDRTVKHRTRLVYHKDDFAHKK